MNKIIDLCYGSVSNAVSVPIVDADHNTVHFIPIYKCVLKRAKWVERQVKVWNENSVARIQGCFDCTMWDVFRDSLMNLRML